MKFSFKIQQYQTDAVDAVARVFQGQTYSAGVSYLRDMGSLSAKPQQLSLMPMADDAAQLELQDLINDSGFKNEALQLTDADLVQNIRALQAESNIHQSDKLVAPLGRCSLDIEMETGTGKTYVYIKTMFELNKRYGVALSGLCRVAGRAQNPNEHGRLGKAAGWFSGVQRQRAANRAG